MEERNCFRCKVYIDNDEYVYIYNNNLFCDEECVVNQLKEDGIVIEVYIDEEGIIND